MELRRVIRVCAVAATVLVAGCGGSSTPTGGNTPVARVRTTTITLAQFEVRVQSTLTSIAQGGGSTSDPAMQTSVRANVLRSLILDTVIAQEAAALHLEATNSEVQQQVNQDAAAVGGMSTLQSQLASAGGSIAQLEDEIRSQLNEQRVENYFAEERAAQTEAQLAQGTPFATVAEAISDDTNTASKGGDMGALNAATLNADDPVFTHAVQSLRVGQYTTTPVHDEGGYDIILLYAKTASTWSVRHILIAAPTPYTVTGRPTWFTEALFSTVQQLCSQHQIQVYISDAGSNPCTSPPPSPSAAAATPSSTAASASP